MKKILFNQTGGFPLTTNILNTMQNAYNIFNSFIELAGDLAILSGCEEISNNVSNGFVIVDGEVFEFKGGIKQDKVRVNQDIETKVFEDGTTKDVVLNRFIEFGDAIENSFNWSDFTRITSVIDLNDNHELLDQRFEVLGNQYINKEVRWVGASVAQSDLPPNWYIANGQNGTDDLLGRFPVGYNPNEIEFNTVGKKGGVKEVRLTVGQMPSHSHSFTADTDFGGSSNSNVVGIGGGSARDKQVTTRSTGSGQAHTNLPPYITLLPIQYIKN